MIVWDMKSRRLKMNLSEKVVQQIKEDFKSSNETAIYEMFRLIEKTKGKQYLTGYLAEENQDDT